MVLKGTNPLYPHKGVENNRTTNYHLLKIQNLSHYPLPHFIAPFQPYKFSINQISTVTLSLTFYTKILQPINDKIYYNIHTFSITLEIFLFRYHLHFIKTGKSVIVTGILLPMIYQIDYTKSTYGQS